MQVASRLKIYGQVQGVFFRQSAKREAENLGLVGWLRNCDNGSVEALVQGKKGKVEEFVAWCKEGPTFAEVERVEVEWRKKLETFEGFKIQ